MIGSQDQAVRRGFGRRRATVFHLVTAVFLAVTPLAPVTVVQAQDVLPCLCPTPGEPVWEWKHMLVIGQIAQTERFALGLVSNLPEPIPTPEVSALLGVADGLGQVQALIAQARSFGLRSNLPVPMPLPRPQVLLQQATQAKKQAIQTLRVLEARTYRIGGIVGTTALGLKLEDLRAQIENLPEPMP